MSAHRNNAPHPTSPLVLVWLLGPPSAAGLLRLEERGGRFSGQMSTQYISPANTKAPQVCGRAAGGGMGWVEGAPHPPPAACESRRRRRIDVVKKQGKKQLSHRGWQGSEMCGAERLKLGSRLSLAQWEKPLNLTKSVKQPTTPSACVSMSQAEPLSDYRHLLRSKNTITYPCLPTSVVCAFNA